MAVTDERDKAEGAKEKSVLRPAQVAAAALAAVTAAFLGSTLGVYGTVLGAGLVSVLTTVGSELYLRSMERTRNAARRTRVFQRSGADGTATVVLPEPEAEASEQATAGWWRRRWPLIAASSLLAFVLGMLVLTGFEQVSGRSLDGKEGSTVSRIVGGGGGSTGGEPTQKNEGGWPAVEQGQPEDQAEQTEPAEPTGSAEPTDTVEPTGPSTEPTEPAELTEPTQTEQQTEPAEPAEPTQPGS